MSQKVIFTNLSSNSRCLPTICRRNRANIYVFGGHSPIGSLSDLWCYDKSKIMYINRISLTHSKNQRYCLGQNSDVLTQEKDHAIHLHYTSITLSPLVATMERTQKMTLLYSTSKLCCGVLLYQLQESFHQ